MPESDRPRPRKPVRWIAALAALCLLPLLGEGLMRGLGHGRSTRFWVEYGSARKWVANRAFLWEDLPARVSPELVREFVKMPKPAGEFRVIVCGDTQAHGWPATLFSWPRLAGTMLGDIVTNRTIRFVNASAPFADAATLSLMLDQSLRLEPDAVVFAPGAGEYFSTHGPGNPFATRDPSFEAVRSRRATRDWRLAQWWQGEALANDSYLNHVDLHSLWASFRTETGIAEKDREPSRERVRRAVAHAQAACARAGVPLLVLSPTASIPDHPPFLSLAADGRALVRHPDLQARIESARADYKEGRWDAGLAKLASVLADHPGLAEAHHLTGRLLQGLKRDDEARQAFLAAWNRDALPLRGDQALFDAVRSSMQTNAQVRLVDLFAVFAADAAGRLRLPAGAQFHDHAHANLTGNHLAARAVLETLVGLFPEQLTSPGARRKLSFPGRNTLARRAGHTVVAEYLERLEGHPTWTGPLFAALPDAAERIEQRSFELAKILEDATHDPNPGKATEQIQALVREHPRDTALLQLLVEHLFMGNQLREIESILNELAMRIPGEPRVYDRMRILFSNTNRPAEAHEAARRAWMANPENMMANIYLGVTRKTITTNNAEVLRYHLELAERFPKAYEVRRNLATSHAVAGDYAKAGSLLKALMEERPKDESPVTAYAEMQIGRGEFNDALRILKEAAERMPKNAQIRYLSGIVYHRVDQILPALAEMQEALRLSPVHEAAKAALAELRKMQDRRAKEWFDAAQKLRGERRYAESMSLYLKALDLFPEGMTLLENVAYLYATCEDPKVRNGAEAVRYADRLLALPLQPRFDNYATAAAAYAADGQFARAVELAERALALAESLPQKPDLEKLRRALDAYRQEKPFLGGR